MRAAIRTELSELKTKVITFVVGGGLFVAIFFRLSASINSKYFILGQGYFEGSTVFFHMFVLYTMVFFGCS